MVASRAERKIERPTAMTASHLRSYCIDTPPSYLLMAYGTASPLSTDSLVSGHVLPPGARHTVDEQTRSQPERQSNYYHDERASKRRLGGHQEDDAEQQGCYGLQRCQEDRVIDALLKGLGQRAVWCLSRQPLDGTPAWFHYSNEHEYQAEIHGRSPKVVCEKDFFCLPVHHAQ